MQPDHSYGETALETYRRAGYDAVEFWCVGARHCGHWTAIKIEEAVERWGPATPIIKLARRGRCLICGRRGVHVQVVRNDHVPQTRNYVMPDARLYYDTARRNAAKHES